jgi:general secretion pathway protein H
VKETAATSGDQRGFSLLELLVTLFVVVLITSLVTLNVTSGGYDIRLEAKVRNLADVASYALDEAQMLGRDYGLLLQQLDVDGEVVYSYSWRERLPEGWRRPDSGKDIFAQQQLPSEVELLLELEDVPVAEISLGGGEEEAAPQVVLYASGETTAGAIEVRLRETSELLWRVQWDLLGRFELLRRGEVEEER